MKQTQPLKFGQTSSDFLFGPTLFRGIKRSGAKAGFYFELHVLPPLLTLSVPLYPQTFCFIAVPHNILLHPLSGSELGGGVKKNLTVK